MSSESHSDTAYELEEEQHEQHHEDKHQHQHQDKKPDDDPVFEKRCKSNNLSIEFYSVKSAKYESYIDYCPKELRPYLGGCLFPSIEDLEDEYARIDNALREVHEKSQGGHLSPYVPSRSGFTPCRPVSLARTVWRTNQTTLTSIRSWSCGGRPRAQARARARRFTR